MRVLLLVRKDMGSEVGGDTTQVSQTAQALRSLGVKVEIDDSALPSLRDYDVVHLFHLDRPWENLVHVRRAKASARAVVLSPIYWPTDEFNRRGRRGLQRLIARHLGPSHYENLRLAYTSYFSSTGGNSARVLYNVDKARREMLASVGVLLPNSRAEASALREQFGCKTSQVVVPNAVDDSRYAAEPKEESSAGRAGVLCVGRIEPRKNQLGLIQALEGSGIPLTIVGESGAQNRRYEKLCRRAAGPDVQFLGRRDSHALAGLYRRARVHCCPSWYETPGLASLEAALSGCSLVVTSRGSTEEYFDDDVSYCDPGDAASIRWAILNAIEMEPSPDLIDRIRKSYSWTNAARRTIEGYELALQQR